MAYRVREQSTTKISPFYLLYGVAPRLPLLEDAFIKTAADGTIALENRHEEMTALFKVMPFGLCNAPATFQRLMNTLLSDLIDKCVCVYLDDIVIYSKTLDEHVEHIRQVLDRLNLEGLKLNLNKCCFAKKKISFLGHIVGENGIFMDPTKVESINKFLLPKNTTELKSFLGLCSYYRKFIQDFAKTAYPLNCLLKNEKQFLMGEKEIEAFEVLKSKIMAQPVLQSASFDRPFVLATDASVFAVGAVLSQIGEDGQEHPVQFIIRGLSKHELNYSTGEKECLAIIYSLKKFRHYLLGGRFVLITDHQSLKALLNTPEPSGKFARWTVQIQEFDYELVYRPGKLNHVADALSRLQSKEIFSVETETTREKIVEKKYGHILI